MGAVRRANRSDGNIAGKLHWNPAKLKPIMLDDDVIRASSKRQRALAINSLPIWNKEYLRSRRCSVDG
jgi:hypothetical protein